jgi:molybdenum cofactor cytidylyltransferase
MQELERGTKIGAVVLAGGSSLRMGRLKQLLPIDGQPMVRRVVEAVCAAGLAQVVVVVGAGAEAVQRTLAGLPVEPVVNEAWMEGMSTSLHTGLRALRPEIEAAIVILADQPALSPGLIRAVVDHYRATAAPIVVPLYRGQRGNPVLFGRAVFPELLAVEGDRGGRALLTRHGAEVERFETDDPAVVLDVDTLQDYEKVKGVSHDNQPKP